MTTTKHLLKGDAELKDLMKMFEAQTGRRPTPAEVEECKQIMSGMSRKPPVSSPPKGRA